MALFESAEKEFAEAAQAIAYCNPFLPERIEWEKRALKDAFVESDVVWHAQSFPVTPSFPNLQRLTAESARVAERARERLRSGAVKPTPAELELYENLVLFTVYHEFEDRILETVEKQLAGLTRSSRIRYYPSFEERLQSFVQIPGIELPMREQSPHVFAMFFHLRRAFFHIFSNLVGSSMAMARLRGAIWQSIFTHDMKRYRGVLYSRMGDITTLITGRSGTGKELVARAIGLSRYVPFDEEKQEFTTDFSCSFYPLNLSALSSTLIESELFGHRRGSFTGALDDHSGWFEVCGPLGSVFLDEIGELDPAIQVKLLRLLQTRTFQRLGDTSSLSFEGKVIAATNSNLTVEMQEGRFREDFYYRLCSDIIETPSLAAQLAQDCGELRHLIGYVARRLVGEEAAEDLAQEVAKWVEENLGPDYSWPGNFRELEQCVRNIMVRGEYTPQRCRPPGLLAQITQDLETGEITAEELLRRYCTLVYSKTKNYEETARRLSLDRRTVKAKIDPELLEELEDECG